jgi:hypothetical protein
VTIVTFGRNKEMKLRENDVLGCRKLNAYALRVGFTIIEYVRNKSRRPVGVIVSFRHPRDKKVYIGWSLCKTSVDKYNKDVGLAYAIDRALPLYAGRTDVPNSIRQQFESMEARAGYYFKEKRPSVNVEINVDTSDISKRLEKAIREAFSNRNSYPRLMR